MLGSFPQRSPITNFLKKQGTLFLDGGLATELENLGHDLNHPLWSARLLLTKPDDIRKIHLSYLKAGADCITTASYQASISGFVDEGMSKKQAKSLLKMTVTLACMARDQHVGDFTSKETPCFPAIIAAGIGPYGAYLADGSEFCGNYCVSADELRTFHEPRWEILADSAADLFACETIPSQKEAEVLLQLLLQEPKIHAWISFSCRDGKSICDGTPLAECAALFADCEQVVAVGVNCTAPRFITSLIEQVRQGAPNKPVVVYPNSGEIYDGRKRTWTGISDIESFAKLSCQWRKNGAKLLGGCCRTGPLHIKAIRQAVLNQEKRKAL